MERAFIQTNRTKTARQIEMLSLIEKSPDTYAVADLCQMFGVEVATAHRDLHELRELGIDIHSTRNRLTLLNALSEKDYRELLSAYLTSVNGIISFPKNISLTVKQLKGKTLHVFTTLVGAIEKKKKVTISYLRQHDSQISKYLLEPYDVIPGTRDWRLIAKSDGIYKQFIVGGIKEIELSGGSFKRSGSYSSNDYYARSFGFFSGPDVIDVALQFSNSAATIVSSKTWSEEQEIKRNEDGSIILKMKVNSIEEVGSWILTWGGDVRVLEPAQLRIYVLGKAQGIIENNHD